MHPAVNQEHGSARQVRNLMTFLANTYVLLVKTHNFHWNVEGPQFFSLHELFEKQYTALFENADVIAERIRALNKIAPGSMRTFLKMASIKEAEIEDMNESAMLHELVENHEEIERDLKQFMEQADEDRDQGTLDLFVQSIRMHEKMAWMLRSHFPAR